MTPPQSSTSPSLLVIEGGLALITIATAALFPHAGCKILARISQSLEQLARKRILSLLVVGAGAALLRLLILPFVPVPQPFITDDFSYLLAAATFASGHLTNPTHPMWVHLETFHVTFKPTYMSMYFPAQGLLLAAGKLILGHPWYGVWASAALMCAAICWMLQGWLPPRWALLGGMLAILRLALFSYWGNTYFGGTIAAIGGALVLGALPRLWRYLRTRDFFWMGLGISILALSRPYEGLFVSVPALVALGWQLKKKPRPAIPVLTRRAAPGLILLLLTVGFYGYYNHRVFGNVFTPPYAVNRATYAVAPYFVWQSARPEPIYRHQTIRDFYMGWELDWFKKSRSLSGLLEMNALKWTRAAIFFFGIVLLLPLVMLPRALRDRRMRFLAIAGLVSAAGLEIEIFLQPHYAAPFTAGIYALLLQSMRHLQAWRFLGRPSGLFLVRAIPVVCAALAVLRIYAQPLNLYLTTDTFSTRAWFGTQPLGLARARVLNQLESYPGRQLAIVRYAPDHQVVDDWVYNDPDIDASPVVWARDMSPAENEELLRYFNNRKVWLIEPDAKPPRISPYPGAPDHQVLWSANQKQGTP